MFSTISWSEFAIMMGAATAIYYVAILLIYYRKELPYLFARKTPSPRRDLSIPVTNGVMGSVLFDEDDLVSDSPASVVGSNAREAESASHDEEEEDSFYGNDDFDDEAEQAKQYALVDELVSRLTDIVSSRHRLQTPEVLELLQEQINTSENTIYLAFKEAITEDLINKFFEYRGTRLTAADLRVIWP